MKPITDLISRLINPTGKTARLEKPTTLHSHLPLGNKTTRAGIYEVEVFNFLFDNRNALGIQNVIKFTNLKVDGAIFLLNGMRLAIEVKLRMNWLKACQSEYEFRKFVNETNEAKTNPVDGAIVFFEEFSGDWAKKSRKAKNVWGWEAWYLNHCDAIAGKHMDLVMLCNGELQGYPD